MVATVPERRVLIIKLGALGDVVVATPHIERILAAYPGDAVYLLTAPAFAPLFAAHPRLEVKAVPRKGGVAMWQALTWVRRMHFAAVYDLQGSDRSRMLTWLSGAPRRVGIGPALCYTHRSPHDDRSAHIFERLNALLLGAGLPAAEPHPRLWTDARTRAEVDRWLLERRPAGRPLVLMHAGSSARWLSKRWEEARFAELARRLEQQGLAVVWLGGDEERGLNQRLATVAGIDATGAFDIAALAELATRARFAVVNDSGPMHVLSTAAIPVYAFFGPTDWRRSHAVGQAGHVLRQPVECSPCHLPVCPPAQAHRCLSGITVQQVFERLQRDGLLGRD